ncbi:unnamed protein product [Cylindrotheca closterium]|uniref:nitric-oxide synthase (NADPH) n=1 Tax=Cylindrotheca closterium TaxID=2856 RepID=A0AAD2G1T2_9STRA|nr:unnamed protein product [Cylindrotheca closterium]
MPTKNDKAVDMPLADLKKSFLQFSSDMNNKGKKTTKKEDASSTQGKLISSSLSSNKKEARPQQRGELTQNLQAFQAKMNTKLRTTKSGKTASVDEPPTYYASYTAKLSDEPKDTIGASYRSYQSSGADTESSGASDLGESLSEFLPKTFRSRAEAAEAEATGSEKSPVIVSTANQEPQQASPSCVIEQHDDDASDEGLEPLHEEEDIMHDEDHSESLRDEDDNDDDHSDSSSIYEEPLKEAESPSNRKDTLEDLKKFHRSLSKRDMTLVSNQDATSSNSTSDNEEEEDAAAAKPVSAKSLLPSAANLGPTPQLIPSKKDRASELQRQNVETPKDDLISSLRAFQSQIDQKLHKGGAVPAATATATTGARIRQKAPTGGRPSRHKSVEVEHVSPPPAVKRSIRRGSMLEMPKSDSKRKLQASKSAEGQGLVGAELSSREIEDRNFRKWFESKMEARVGSNVERFILEEDDHEEGPVEDKPGHGPLVVNVLHSEVAPPSSEDSSPQVDTPTAAGKHNPLTNRSSQDKTKSKDWSSSDRNDWSSSDRATQIKQQNTQMSRDEIKASLLSFQTQLKTKKPAPRAKPKTSKNPAFVSCEFEAPEPETANKTSIVSSEFRLPEAAAVPLQQAKSRIVQLETENGSLTRDQLTASLLAFRSSIEKKVPSDGAKKETKPKAAAAADLKAKDAIGETNNIRRAKGREGRIKALEEEQATIPRNVMLASLQKFQADIQGKLNTSQSTEVSLDSPKLQPVKKTTKLENFDASTDGASMEVTEGEYLTKVSEHSSKRGGADGKNEPETKADAATSNEAQDASREEMKKKLLSFQSEIQGRIEKRNSVGGKVDKVPTTETTAEATTEEEKSSHPRKFESMLKNLEDLKKRNEDKVSTMQNLDRMRKRNEEKVSAMISAISPEDATEMPPWFAEFAQQQEDKFQELVQISEQRNKEIMRLSNDSARSQVRSLSNQIDKKKDDFSQTNSSKPLGNGQKNTPALSDLEGPGQFMGYPESQASATETSDVSLACEEATYFIQRFAQETGLLHGKRLEERLEEIKRSIVEAGSYTQTYDELQYGCRLAWRNCGQFIMRSAYASLTVNDCRQAKTADDCFNQCVKHLKEVFDGGSESPVISVFQPKQDNEFAPVRIWNRDLLGYAAYKRDDGSIMGDSSNLDFTVLCMKFGWIPPEEKSDFDILPLLISDAARGHDNPKVFVLPPEAIHEVEFDHPDFDLFRNLNLRWHAQASDASMAIDIGGLLYQTAPFTRLYQASEISSFLLDRSRYGFAEAIAAACALKKSPLSLWRDNVQLQTQKSILNSFARDGLRCLDYHAVSEEFVEFHSSQVQDFGSCPADWIKVVAPATSSMTAAYHQEMADFVVKPQYLIQKPLWDDLDLAMPLPISIAPRKRGNNFVFNRANCHYDHVFVYYASETGTSLRLATLLVGDFGGSATGPIPLDSLPDLLLESVEKKSLAIIVTSTASSGAPPLHAKSFLGGMSQLAKGSLHNIDFAICGLCNSAYTGSLASFASVVEANLKRAGCVPAMGIHYVDTLEAPEEAFADFRTMLFEEVEGILYKRNPTVEPTKPMEVQLTTMAFEKLVPVLKLDSVDDPGAVGGGKYLDSWERNSNKLKRSLDLFRFKLEEEEGENRLQGLAAGDHVVLYPHNMDDVVETVMRHVSVPDAAAAKKYLKKFKDLSKPLSLDELSFLNDYIQGNESAMSVLDELLTTISADSSLSVEKLVQIMPPGSIPMNWILKYVPSMDPRFYSIASIDGTKNTVSIVQSVYTFEGSGKAGVASRWLRSLTKGQQIDATFSRTKFRLPDDEGAPVLLISAGPGIAPCRTFWLAGRTNPTYLFCGCKSPEELPYSTEIELLRKKGLLHPFVAYSHSSGRKMELEDLLRQERATLLDLLHNSRTRLYVCGSPELNAKVRNSLAMILAQGHSRNRGMGMAKAMERLALMSQSELYVREVYGNAIGDATRSDPMHALWQESTVKVVRALAALEKLEVAVPPSRPRQNSRQKGKLNEENHAYNPMISGT